MTESVALFDSGTRHLQRGELDAAEALLRAAIDIAPDLAEAHANLALALERRGLPAEAEAHHRRALSLAPGFAQGWSNYAAMLEHLGRDAQAEAAYRHALQCDPASPTAWTGLGVLLELLRRDAEAEHCQRVALRLQPGWPPAAFNLATLLLRQGRYAEGWPLFEARDWYRDLEAAIGLPRWRGEALAGRRILIGVEAGHGDMIQFVRYATELRRRGAAAVGVLCHPALGDLLRAARDVDRVIPLGGAPADLADPPWDFWCPALSLPGVCATAIESIPATLPYLAADPARLRRWAGRLGGDDRRPRIGLVWRGNPHFAHDAARSLGSVADLAPLATVPGLRWIVLNKGSGESEAPPFPATLLWREIEDFADTAAIVAQLDLLIAVDTAAAHLAGALGRPCWVLLPARRTDWRWLEGRDDSPWYPGVMRLFRQRPGQDWSGVVAEVAAALRATLGSA